MTFAHIVKEELNSSQFSSPTNEKGKPLLGGLVTNTGVYKSPELGSTAYKLASLQFASSKSSNNSGFNMSSEAGDASENITDSKKTNLKQIKLRRRPKKLKK